MAKRPVTFTASAPAPPVQQVVEEHKYEYLQGKEIAVMVPFQQAILTGILIFVTCLVILLVDWYSKAWPFLVGALATDLLWALLLWRNHVLVMKKELATGQDINGDGKVGKIPLKFYVPKSETSTRLGNILCNANSLNELAKYAVAFRYRQVKKRGETAFSEKKWVGRFKPFHSRVDYLQLIGQLVEMEAIAPVSDLTNERGYAETSDIGKDFFNYVSSDQFLLDVKRELENGNVLTIKPKRR